MTSVPTSGVVEERGKEREREGKREEGGGGARERGGGEKAMVNFSLVHS